MTGKTGGETPVFVAITLNQSSQSPPEDNNDMAEATRDDGNLHSSIERDKEIDELLQKRKDAKKNGTMEKSIKGLRELLQSVTPVLQKHTVASGTGRTESVSKCSRSGTWKLGNKEKKPTPREVTFSVKQATPNGHIEKQVIDYVKKSIDKNNFNVITNFNWRGKNEGELLVVFCNYSSRIGVDVEMSLRGVEEPKVILIILHYTRKALLRDDLSDDDYLLSDDLKNRAACIAHFAFEEDSVYECWQNDKAKDKLCADLEHHGRPPQLVPPYHQMHK